MFSNVSRPDHQTGGTPTDWEDSSDNGVDNDGAHPAVKETTPEPSEHIERYLYPSHLMHSCLNLCPVGSLPLFAKS
jgi:hypothetical protein